MDTSIVDQIITGRVKPHIYAFRTGTIPDYLKVGDTYRPVEARLEEWRNHYNSLEEVYREKATVSDDVFFRDYAIHQFFEDVLNLHRLQREDIPSDVYYSNEFFQGATKENVESAVEDIRSDYLSSGNHYHYYKFAESRIPVETHYPRNEKPFNPREEQAQTVTNFLNAKEKGRTNLLMYAVMRFGKSFTAMLCAKAMDAKLVVVLCGKTSVEDEWKRNVEIPKNFDGYSFKNRTDLDNNHNLISEARASGERIVLFLTLQDLSGADVKERHKELFENEIDLVIIDETHFGARAPEYGRVLQEEFGVKASTGNKEYQEEEEIKDVDEVLKTLHTNLKLHLSGTPYRILMGSEFAPEDVVAFYQFSDIVDAQEKWDRDNLDNPDKKEWDNPYYGFPQMIRFAFNPSASARKLMKELREKGKTCALSALFQPSSITKDDAGLYHHFEHEEEILELMEVIDGSREDDELFGFLDSKKIQDGQMCRHMVCVLPFRASCDALQALLESNKNRFKNLSEYEFLNIAGHDCPRELQTPAGVKNKIRAFEDAGKKTITFTVNKMLTGSTVEFWDTMLFFKDTASPQEYDQAIFRIQNPYVKEMKAENGDEIKFNMKPQTLLIDFDIDRLFQLQAMKSQIYNANTDVNGNAKLEERMRRELEISPVIVLNKDRLKEVTPNDIMEAISEYSKTRSVADEAKDVPVDMRLMDDPVIKAEIDRQGAISSREGLATQPSKGEGDDVDTGDDSGDGDDTEDNTPSKKKKDKESPEELFRKRFATYYSRILFFTFLSKDKVTNLDNLIAIIDQGEDNIRIAANLDLKKEILVHLRLKMDGNKLGALEFKIRNLNRLEADVDLPPIERAKTAMRRFSRLSEAEITTPENIAKDIVSLLPVNCTPDMRYLDIAAKQGEFAIALMERFGDEAKSSIWSLPTSGAAYEFTRKIYEFLGLPVDHIYSEFDAFDLTRENKQEYIDTLKNMKFDVIVGNPPYQEKGRLGGNGDAPIYQHFSAAAMNMPYKYIALILPAKWFTAGSENLLKDFRKTMLKRRSISNMVAYANSSDVFDNVEIKGGVCYYLDDASYDGNCHYSFINHNIVEEADVNLGALDVFIRVPQKSAIVVKVAARHETMMESIVSSDTPFGFPSNVKHSKKRPFDVCENKNDEFSVQLYHIEKNVRKVEYVRDSDIRKNREAINLWKVFIPEAGGSGNDKTVLGKPELASPNSVCSQSYLYIPVADEVEGKNLISYLKCRFVRFLISAMKITQHAHADVYRYVPLQDFSKPWTDAELYEKYGLSQDEIKFIDATIKPMD